MAQAMKKVASSEGNGNLTRDGALTDIELGVEASHELDHVEMVTTVSPRGKIAAPAPSTPPQSKIANPAPLGLLAFGMTTIMLMFLDTGWVDGKGGFKDMVACYAIFYGGGIQFLAGMWEMARGKTFPATAFCSYGAFWLGWGLLHVLSSDGILSPSSDFKAGERLFLVQWGLLTTVFFLMTLQANYCLQVVFGTLLLTFFLLAAGLDNDNTKTAAGYVGFICGLSAVYTAAAEMAQETFNVVLPGLAALA
ncbi:unnamed protein product [Discosporangium mesarthrocarpum]